MPPKRKATSPVRPPATKKPHREPNGDGIDHAHMEEHVGIVQREFYPPEMSNIRCEQYNNNEIPRPIELLNSALEETAAERNEIPVGDAVVHWFKRDLRIHDNRALSMAGEKAKGQGVPLIGMFIVSPQDYQAHLTSPPRVDFELRTLQVLKEDLAELDIPLYVTTIEDRKKVPGHILEKCAEWGAKHVYCNIEYEVDELRREAKLVKNGLKKGISFVAVHDDVVVTPSSLMTGAGKQYSVYSPWFRAWIKYIHEHPHTLHAYSPPPPNPPSARQTFASIFTSAIPPTPPNKTLPPTDRDRLASIWPAGEHEALARLTRFLAEKASAYKTTRNIPAANSTALLSVHLSTGTLSARTAVRAARDANTTSKLDGGNPGIGGWISEVAWRDFYKHVLVQWPYVCMHKPFKYEYTNIRWEYNDEHFKRWCEGTTGFPIVDAAMRQVKHMAYMHNRCRMIVASFLAKDLLLDWRMGERYFMEHLIDGDFASNNGGWGFSASTGVDPQPYFRIFNPLLQSEKFDEHGEYIRKWIPELADVKGKAIHDPYGRGAAKEAERAGYPRPMVEHKVCRERALARYKEGLGRSTANVGGGVHN
ncbi:deoxyribodipyrimidine photo-lyase [Teratosphaeria destructans]|uniref:Deoxyribodipyrimidine photo-lyase n=1 Tax=Teratosphaeria destructans TaxID=418781 RepID=A0A9W7SXE7_9PEZI|nr:deoxyribodipyrimidine photo-lyase [Teratosphaeria destructans]